MQNAIVSFKELCGLSAVANLKQCILALSPRLTGPDNTPLLVFNLKDQYPNLEPQSLLSEVLKKVVTTYEMVSHGKKVCQQMTAVLSIFSIDQSHHNYFSLYDLSYH